MNLEGDEEDSAILARIRSLRQHQVDGRRSPPKPLLVLLALGQLATTGSSEVTWSRAEQQLAELIAEFGTPSRTGGGRKVRPTPSHDYVQTAFGY